MTHQPEVSYPYIIEVNFPEGQLDIEIKTNFSYQDEAIEQEYTRPKEKHHRHNPDLKQQINTSEVLHTFLPNQIDLKNRSIGPVLI